MAQRAEKKTRPSDPVRPFRWDLAQRQRLGRLVEGPVAPNYDGFLNDVLDASARVIAMAGDSNLYFVGRSLESMFDLLSGLLLDTSWSNRLQLLHFSNRFAAVPRIRSRLPEAIPALRMYLESLSLQPDTIAKQSRDIALIDVVSSGATLGNLIDQFRTWSHEEGIDWDAVAHRLRIVGVTRREKTSPKTWRWQQHAPWATMLPAGSIKNVSIPERMYRFVADEQSKVSISFPPWRWGHETVAQPRRDAATLEALRFAATVFDHGMKAQVRAQFAAALARQPTMRRQWFRSLALEVKR